MSYLGITYIKNEIVSDVIQWFEDYIDFLNYGNPRQELRTAMAKTEEVKRLVLDMIREMNLDIEDFRIEEKQENHIDVYTKHTVNGYSTELTLSEESSGIKRLFGLLPFTARSLVVGATLVIDGLDAKIHSGLLHYVVVLYNNMEINKNGAQLIFTSHDLSTMNNDVFRRDEIWLAAKGKEQYSKLYSLVECKNKKGESVRMDAKYDKQCLGANMTQIHI